MELPNGRHAPIVLFAHNSKRGKPPTSACKADSQGCAQGSIHRRCACELGRLRPAQPRLPSCRSQRQPPVAAAPDCTTARDQSRPKSRARTLFRPRWSWSCVRLQPMFPHSVTARQPCTQTRSSRQTCTVPRAGRRETRPSLRQSAATVSRG